MSEYLSVRAHIEMSVLSSMDRTSAHTGEPEYRVNSVHPQLEVLETKDGERSKTDGEDIYADQTLALYIPEWNRRQGCRGQIDIEALTRALAFEADHPFLEFPDKDEILAGESASGTIHRMNAAAADAVDWLLDRIEGDLAEIDLEEARVDCSGTVFDGTGKLLAFPMTLGRDGASHFLETYGPDPIRKAMENGHLFRRGDRACAGQGMSFKAIDRVFSADPVKYGGPFRYLRVAWDPEVFENAIRPHVDPRPFSRPPHIIDGMSAGVIMLEALIERGPRNEPEQENMP